MRYSVDPSVFEINPRIKFGILVGRALQNSETLPSDQARLRNAEQKMRESYQDTQVRELLNISLYRSIMTKAGINPNKYPPSVEAMFKRIIKGTSLPAINALVDLCNAISIEQMISLGAHDLADIHADLEVRFAKGGDLFLPFGATDYESVDVGELVFVSGNKVQTRKWIWRQSELGKTTIDSKNLFFQLVGFDDDKGASLNKAMEDIEHLITERFQGSCERYIVDQHNRSIEF